MGLVAAVGFGGNADPRTATAGFLRASGLAELLDLPDPWEVAPVAVNLLSQQGRLSDPAAFHSEMSSIRREGNEVTGSDNHPLGDGDAGVTQA